MTFSASHDDVRKAAERIGSHIVRTPLMTSTSLDELAGAELLFKPECLQRGGSFKVRGALNSVLAGLETGDDRGIITVSSGNQAVSVAVAGRMADVPTTVVMLDDGPTFQRDAALANKAEVVDRGIDRDNRHDIGDQLLDDRNLRWIHPFEDYRVIAGHGTAALELCEDAAASGRPLDALVVPVSGGAHIAGAALALQGGDRPVRLIGAEPAMADDFARSLAAREIIRMDDQPPTVAVAANSVEVGLAPWSIIGNGNGNENVVADVVTVSEEEIVRAMWLAWMRLKLVVEPSGALALAAVLTGRVAAQLPGIDRPRIGCILTGGNVDPATILSLPQPAAP